MQSTTITLLPTPAPDVSFLARGLAPDVDRTFPAAAYNGEILEFEHKITLASSGNIVQVMTPDANGVFVEALPENAFPIADEFLGIQMLPPVSNINGPSFSFRLFKNTDTQNPVVPGTGSQLIFENIPGNAPQIILAEVVRANGISIGKELNFIIITDVRTDFTSARVLFRPGETAYLKTNSNNDLIIQL